MEIPDKIRQAAQRLKEGHRVNRITVRDFLSHFGAERRGAAKVEGIRRILNSLDLQTDPDFETVWIDEPIWLRLKDGVAAPDSISLSADQSGDDPTNPDFEEIVLESKPSAVNQAVEQSESAPTSAEPNLPDGSEKARSSDPTFRIGSLPAANKKLSVVNQDDPISKAITIMVEHNFAQLPVMHGEREVKGVVTWKSIACWQTKRTITSGSGRIAECREDARIIDANRTLFDAIPTIVETGYVLVRQRDRRISGIVTESDLSEQFKLLAEPFLLIREIELNVRRLIEGKVTSEDFDVLYSESAPTHHSPQNITDLNFGAYIRLFQHPHIWERLNLVIDRGVLVTLLDKVREIRNDVVHFDPDPITEDQLATLKRAAHFMQELHEFFQ